MQLKKNFNFHLNRSRISFKVMILLFLCVLIISSTFCLFFCFSCVNLSFYVYFSRFLCFWRGTLSRSCVHLLFFCSFISIMKLCCSYSCTVYLLPYVVVRVWYKTQSINIWPTKVPALWHILGIWMVDLHQYILLCIFAAYLLCHGQLILIIYCIVCSLNCIFMISTTHAEYNCYCSFYAYYGFCCQTTLC